MEAVRILSPSQNCIRALWKMSFSFLFLHDCLYFKLNIWMHFYPQLSLLIINMYFLTHVIHCELCFRYFLNICRIKKCVVRFLSWHKYAVDHMLYRKVIHSFQIWKWKPVWNSIKPVLFVMAARGHLALVHLLYERSKHIPDKFMASVTSLSLIQCSFCKQCFPIKP